MYAETRLTAAMVSMVRGIEAPPVPMAAIRDRMTAPLAAGPRRIPFARYAIAAAAAVALFFAIFPKASLALFERIVVNSYAAAHRLMDWTPPPPPPKSLEAAQKSVQLSLAAAQRKVDFTIVPPAGVPSDAVFVRIASMPSLAYDETTHRWSKGTLALAFEYRRSGGRTFSLQAEKDDPRLDLPGKYMWFADDLPGGKVAMTKHLHFAWRNGDQMMSTDEDEGITATEIQTIRAAMRGEAIVHNNVHPTIVKRYQLP